MNVRELIALLQEMDPEMPVLLESTLDNETVVLKAHHLRPGEWFDVGPTEAHGPQSDRTGGVCKSAVKCLWFFA